MKKDKKWFVDKWTKERDKSDVHDPMYHFINEFIADVNQLGEPEVLSQEWIDEHKASRINNLRKMTTSDVVPVEKLQDLLVPKHELPVVPAWFHEWWKNIIKGERNLFHNIKLFHDELYSYGTEEEYDYINNPVNKKKLLNIIVNELDYEVEEDQKYYVDLDSAAYVAKWIINDKVDIYTDAISSIDEFEFHLTEQEIKDFDPRYWAFATKVEEDNNE